MTCKEGFSQKAYRMQHFNFKAGSTEGRAEADTVRKKVKAKGPLFSIMKKHLWKKEGFIQIGPMGVLICFLCPFSISLKIRLLKVLSLTNSAG